MFAALGPTIVLPAALCSNREAGGPTAGTAAYRPEN